MKTYKITISGKEIDITQNEDGSFNKPNIVKELEPVGTALKPAFEPICMAMKPLSEKNYVANVLKYGTGGINIDESRVEAQKGDKFGGGGLNSPVNGFMGNTDNTYKKGTGFRDDTAKGRFPANFIHDNSEEVRECFPDANHKTGGAFTKAGDLYGQTNNPLGYDDSGNASRFFKSIVYNPKASKSERNKGCEGLEEKRQWASEKREASSFDIFQNGKPPMVNKNNHPTVKPIALMEYLIKMVTPKEGLVLDPFTGSGSTGVAAKQSGFSFIGIELDKDYCEIARARLSQSNQDQLF